MTPTRGGTGSVHQNELFWDIIVKKGHFFGLSLQKTEHLRLARNFVSVGGPQRGIGYIDQPLETPFVPPSGGGG